MREACRAAGIVPFWSVEEEGDGGRSDLARVVLVAHASGDDAGFAPEPSARGGELSFNWVEDAIRDAQRPEHDAAHADAIVTAPISKTSWNLAGLTKWPGHTELLAERFGAARSGMLFAGPSLCVMLATIHVPLMRVGGMLTTERVLEAIELAHRACVDMLATRGASPRIAVCGLNPHAGEGGILGTGDDRIIAPAVALARAKGIDASGPLPGDTVFSAAA
jgi:4-hydroxythreonine-4-phosphate dehydrogenase